MQQWWKRYITIHLFIRLSVCCGDFCIPVELRGINAAPEMAFGCFIDASKVQIICKAVCRRVQKRCCQYYREWGSKGGVIERILRTFVSVHCGAGKRGSDEPLWPCRLPATSSPFDRRKNQGTAVWDTVFSQTEVDQWIQKCIRGCTR